MKTWAPMYLFFFLLLLNIDASLAQQNLKIVLKSEVEWEQLNPNRGENSPMAASLWGDRTGPGPSGFLLKPVDGFKSPPHIHTANYHGVVIRGRVHNAEPDAKDLYLPTGSFWTQPGGGIHITAARGNSLAYIEVDGEFDVLPAEMSASKDTLATVIPVSNMKWVNPSGIPNSPDRPKVAVLWGKPGGNQVSGTLVKFPAGFTGMMNNSGSKFHAVVIQGEPKYWMPGKIDIRTLEPGSYFGSSVESSHQISCEGEQDCMIYVRMEGELDFKW